MSEATETDAETEPAETSAAEDKPAPAPKAGATGSSAADDTAASADTAVATGKPAPAPKAGPTESSGVEDPVRENPRKIREGIVVSNAMDKTAVVESIDRVRHRRYAKTVQRSTRLFAHDETNDANVGDLVRIQETRPLSKKKRWRLVDIIERAR